MTHRRMCSARSKTRASKHKPVPGAGAVWVDLDETLIFVWQPLVGDAASAAIFGLPWPQKPPSAPELFRLHRVAGLSAQTYAIVRPGAREFLRAVRAIAPTRMLTFANRAYALAMNDRFSLGFRSREIVARENLRVWQKEWSKGQPGVDPAAVLVENAGDEFRFDHRVRGEKITYLGIGNERVVELPDFRGHRSDTFRTKWRECLGYVKRLRESV